MAVSVRRRSEGGRLALFCGGIWGNASVSSAFGVYRVAAVNSSLGFLARCGGYRGDVPCRDAGDSAVRAFLPLHLL